MMVFALALIYGVDAHPGALSTTYTKPSIPAIQAAYCNQCVLLFAGGVIGLVVCSIGLAKALADNDEP